MEEVDGIILRSLGNLGCELSSDIKNVKQLSPAAVVDAVVRCLRLIKPEMPLPSTRLPESITARFRFATTLSEAITELGFKGGTGYQLLLYGSEPDIRRLLMFLIEKLPKETTSSTAFDDANTKKADMLELTKRVAAERLKRELRNVRVPWFCKSYQCVLENLFWRQPDSVENVKFKADYSSTLRNLLSNNTVSFQNLPSNVVAFNTRAFYGVDKGNTSVSAFDDDELSIVTHVRAFANPEKAIRASVTKKSKPALLPKPVLLQKSSEDSEKKLAEIDATQVQAENLQKQIGVLRDEIAALEYDLEQRMQQVDEQEEELKQVRNMIQRLEKTIPEKETELKQLQLTSALTENIDENQAQLKDYLAKSEARMEKLVAQRDDYCAPIYKEIIELKSSSNVKSKSELLAEELEHNSRKAEEIKDEMEAKKNHLRVLKKEYERMEKDINREYYTKRILEIVANITKQKQEIARIIDDIRAAQKDVNMLSGKLERCFTASDELLFKDATRDDIIKRAYKCVATLHEYCGDIVKRIENTGQITREIRELDDQIETESQRSTESALDKLVNDYCELKLANEQVMSKLKDLGISV